VNRLLVEIIRLCAVGGFLAFVVEIVLALSPERYPL
jgi:hypothetical protein